MAGPRALVLILLVILLCLCIECSAAVRKRPCKHNGKKYKAGEFIEALEDYCAELKCSKKGKKVELTPIQNCTWANEDPCEMAGGTQINGQCLIFSEDTKTWQDSYDACKENGQRLVVLRDPKAVSDYVTDKYVSDLPKFWLGASDIETEGSWLWLNGQQLNVDSFPWAREWEPNDSGGEDCLAFESGYGYNDQVCSNRYQYVCELWDSSLTCDCDHHGGIGGISGFGVGCKISQKAPENYACKCMQGANNILRCDGTVVDCQDPSSKYCTNPGDGFNSCEQGGGNCGGYSCDCDHHGGSDGGCKISTPAGKGTACKCFSYTYAWWIYSCEGKIVHCLDDQNDKCENPDYTKESCEQGGGDCKGY